LEHRGRGLGLGILHRQAVDDAERLGLDLVGERLAQGALGDLLRQRERVVARRRRGHDAAPSPDRVADVAYARAAGALLLPQLATAARDFRARLRLLRAAALAGLPVNNASPDQVALDAAAEELVAQGHRPDLLVGAVDDVDVHYFLPF